MKTITAECISVGGEYIALKPCGRNNVKVEHYITLDINELTQVSSFITNTACIGKFNCSPSFYHLHDESFPNLKIITGKWYIEDWKGTAPKLSSMDGRKFKWAKFWKA